MLGDKSFLFTTKRANIIINCKIDFRGSWATYSIHGETIEKTQKTKCIAGLIRHCKQLASLNTPPYHLPRPPGRLESIGARLDQFFAGNFREKETQK